MSTSPTPQWLPLESNPSILNPFIHRLGCPTSHEFTDVWGLDPDLLAMLPGPCVAMCLLYPSDTISGVRRGELRENKKDVEEPKLFFTQQHDACGNACGTIACIHSVINAAQNGSFSLDSSSVLSKFQKDTSSLPAFERGQKLVECTDLHSASNSTAQSGETEGAGTNDNQNQHFISFVLLKNHIYELDGRTLDSNGKAFPVDHGETSAESFAVDVGKIIKDDFMARDPTSIHFNITALCKIE
ncbi:hypothetical protein TrLO_g15662 [Triparma laevis f. longispina]|uniref:Ubiquitin carboxyl-terminal hydrolase n=1 Tax=Triparma laevis f. longispina TaxID=1714387 RepID=A0A9W7L061_9STRA|nr:hypothetical protein TrLO_g15662 [Triparma laevis f. longispina]